MAPNPMRTYLRLRRSAFQYEALRAGSMSATTKRRWYQRIYKSLISQARSFEKSEFADLEVQKGYIQQLTPLKEIQDEDELDARLSFMYNVYRDEDLSVSELRQARQEFYDDYSEVLHDRFFKNDERTEIDPEVYNKFTNFVQIAHADQIGSVYDSERGDRFSDFFKSVGKEGFSDFEDADELYTAFFDYAEAEGMRAKYDTGFY